MENNEKQAPETKKCQCNDWKTFVIAFLTSVIVVALYHFGTGFFAICSGTYDCGRNISSEYVLVPVYAMPQTHGPMMREPGRKFHHDKGMREGFHPGKRGNFDGKSGPGRRPMGPAPEAPAPAAPAPAK